MKEGLMKKIYDQVDNQWVFIMKATEKYKQEFNKRAKIGEPPKIEDVIEQLLDGADREKEKSSPAPGSDDQDKKEEKEEKEKSGKKSKTKAKKTKEESS